MNKRFRYGLLAGGVVFFLVAAPLIVLYIRGVTYDFSAKRFVKNGLLAIRTEPKHALVFLDGVKVRDSAGDISFLKPAEYLVRLSAPGYFDWEKHLRVSSGTVTWVGNNNKKTYLLLKDGERVSLTGGIVDFCLRANMLYTLSANSLERISLSDGQDKKNISLPFELETMECSSDGSLILLRSGQQTLLFLTETSTLQQTSSLFSGQTRFFLYNNQPYALNSGKIYEINPKTGQKTALAENARFFTVTDSFLYYASAEGSGTRLYAKNLSSKTVTLLADLPYVAEGSIFVTQNRQVMLQTGQLLYRVNTSPETVSHSVSSAWFDPEQDSLTVVQSGELDWYDFAAQSLSFVTRTSQPLSSILVRRDLGYVFVIKGSGIAALEMDNRDRVNEFVLYAGQDLKKIALDASGEYLYLLDGSKLFKQKIR